MGLLNNYRIAFTLISGRFFRGRAGEIPSFIREKMGDKL